MLMKKNFLIVILILSCQLIVNAQTVFELDRPQSMLISGKGIGQDATVNPFAGEDCYAIVKNIGNEIFFARVQQNGKVIETLTINKNEAVKVKLLIGYELYLDTKTQKKAKASINYEKIAQPKIQYVCSPCGINCDTKVFEGPGQCPTCKMKLVDKKSITHKSVSPSDLSKFLQSTKNLLILDVRTKEEFEGHGDPDFGSLKNSVNIPISDIEKGRYKGLDKNKTLLVYCSHSHRSSRVSYLLTQNGFKNVVNLLGGMSEVTDKSVRK